MCLATRKGLKTWRGPRLLRVDSDKQWTREMAAAMLPPQFTLSLSSASTHIWYEIRLIWMLAWKCSVVDSLMGPTLLVLLWSLWEAYAFGVFHATNMFDATRRHAQMWHEGAKSQEADFIRKWGCSVYMPQITAMVFGDRPKVSGESLTRITPSIRCVPSEGATTLKFRITRSCIID